MCVHHFISSELGAVLVSQNATSVKVNAGETNVTNKDVYLLGLLISAGKPL